MRKPYTIGAVSTPPLEAPHPTPHTAQYIPVSHIARPIPRYTHVSLAQKLKNPHNTHTHVPEPEMKRHNLFLPDELVAKYRQFAEKRQIPMAEMIRLALEKYAQAMEKAQKNG
jgi:hypothetical protein